MLATAPSAYVNDAVWVYQAPYTSQELEWIFSNHDGRSEEMAVGLNSLNMELLDTPGFRTNIVRQ